MRVEGKRFWDSELYALLEERIQGCRFRKQFSIPRFAAALGMSTEGVYKYLRADRVGLDGAKRIIAYSKGTITEVDMLPFLFR